MTAVPVRAEGAAIPEREAAQGSRPRSIGGDHGSPEAGGEAGRPAAGADAGRLATSSHPAQPASGPDPARPASDAGEGHRAIARISEELLPALIARLSASTLGELEIREANWRIRLSRDAVPDAAPGAPGRPDVASGERSRSPSSAAGTATSGPGRTTAASPGSGPASAAPAVSGTAGSAAPTAGQSRTAALRRAVTSPAVGYYTPRTGLTVGQALHAGDVLGTVDVLGVPYRVLAPVDGVLGRILAISGEAVEYGQELVRIDGPERGLPELADGKRERGRAAQGGPTGRAEPRLEAPDPGHPRRDDVASADAAARRS